MSDNNYDELKIQEILEKVQKLIGQMEEADMSLEDLFDCYKKGTLMLDSCMKKIDAIEKELEVITGSTEEE